MPTLADHQEQEVEKNFIAFSECSIIFCFKKKGVGL